jgi:membrane protease YdiL (CAAX protease family)
VCAALLAFFWGVSFFTRDGTVPTAEYYVFQTFMPSLDEEFAYRGTILAMLVAAFGKPYRLAGIQTSWAGLPVVAVFGLVHGYSIVLEGGPIDAGLVALTIFVTGVAGLGLYWLKEKTSSVWLCVVMHSLMNLGSGFFNQFSS